MLSKTEAAFIILSEAKKPMSCKDIIAEALNRKMIKTRGKTPESTLRVDIMKEIGRYTNRGLKPRFRLHRKGIVELN
ncbi:winged helix-turn-helix domain-containing protein [bacterium]|nr:winged helix-turn-helix domain-containing protein [bacterium]